MVAEKKIVASTTRESDLRRSFARRYHAHSPDAGRNESREVLVNAPTPHSRPNPIQGPVPSASSSRNVSQKITVRSSAARLVSHTHRVDQNITDGRTAHIHAVHTATFSLKHFRAIRKIGIEVNAENRLLMLSRVNADTCV